MIKRNNSKYLTFIIIKNKSLIMKYFLLINTINKIIFKIQNLMEITTLNNNNLY